MVVATGVEEVGVEVEVEAEEEEVEEVVEEVVVVEVHRPHPIHRVRVLQEVEDEEGVRIVKRTCNNNWKRF